MKGVLIAIWRLFVGLAFYPIMLGLFFWIWYKGYHWIFGAGVVAAILLLDPIWMRLLQNLRRSKK